MVHISSGNHQSISRGELFTHLKEHLKTLSSGAQAVNCMMDYVKFRIGCATLLSTDEDTLQSTLDNFSKVLLNKWKRCNRYIPRFLETNTNWLDGILITSGETATSSRGRPSSDFALGSLRTKQRRMKELATLHSHNELSVALEMSLRKCGRKDTASAVRRVVNSPRRATVWKNSNKNTTRIKKFSPEAALALFIQLKLTKQQYIDLRLAIKTNTTVQYLPSYHDLLIQKEKCYPNKDSIEVSDTKAEVKLQSLLDHTAERIIQAQSEVLHTFLSNESVQSFPEINLQMDCKWGVDGSGSHSTYKQSFEAEGKTDSYILATSLVPIQLCYEEGSEKTYIWKNQRSSSTRFCRPVKLEFIKETKEVLVNEFSLINEQIERLVPFKINHGNKHISISYTLHKTMVDGKVCNAIADNSSTQKCYICKAGPREYNNLDLLETKFGAITEHFAFGLSSLHAYIRFFEALLHISYRIDIKHWKMDSDVKKKLFQEKKQDVQNKFKSKMGLLVDIVKQGFGTTNDGNSARRFFQNPDLSSEITGIDKNLIYRFSIILSAISSGFEIDDEKFKQYCIDTAKLYVQLYNWYPMPMTVHKILLHGSEIVKYFMIPIGQLSEDAQESRHKEFRYYREHNTRKISRKCTNEDLFKILLVSSDPHISSIRPIPIRRTKTFNADVINLLSSPCVVEENDDVDSEG